MSEWKPDREAAARIIDPDAFDRWTWVWPRNRKQRALAKADLILRLASAPPPEALAKAGTTERPALPREALSPTVNPIQEKT